MRRRTDWRRSLRRSGCGVATRLGECYVRTLNSIRHDVDRLAAIISAPSEYLPTYGSSEQSGLPHIELTSDGLMHWVVCERGSEVTRRTTGDDDELLYWVFESVTSW